LRQISIIAVALLGTRAFATTYVVTPGGTYATFTALMAAKRLAPGDLVQFQASTPGGSATFAQTLTPNGSGTAGQPITIEARPGDTITIDGGLVRANDIYFYDLSYIIIDGLNLRNAAGGPVSGSLTINQCNYITIQNCDIEVSLVGDGVNARRGIAAVNYCNNLQILNNRVAIDDGSWGPGETDCINVMGNNMLIQGNYLSMHNAYDLQPSGHNDCCQTLNCANLVINGNTMDRNLLATFTQGQGIICEWYNTTSSASPTNYGTATITNNVIFGYFGSFGVSCNSRNEPYTSDATVAITFANNTIDSFDFASSAPAQFAHDTTGSWSGGSLTIKNNIFYMRRLSGQTCALSVSAPYAAGNLVSDYNHFFASASIGPTSQMLALNGTFYTWAQWQAAGYDAHGIGFGSTGWVAPVFVDQPNGNYSLPSQSPDIDAGTDLAPLFNADRVGTSRPQGLAWDIGAYEEVPSVQPIAAAPTFSTQPVSQSVASNANVTFTVLAGGAPSPTYQWRLNGVNIPGACSSVLILNGVTAANAGTYTAVATNSSGSVTSLGAALVVGSSSSTPPVISAQPTSQTVNSGSNVTFSVSATGSPAPTYQWRLNAVNLSGATSSTLSLSSVTSANAGTYTVVVTNSAGAVTSQGAVLTVNTVATSTAPVITTQPVSQTVNTGSNVTFSVTATGSPAPTYRWHLNSVALSGTSPTLTLNSVTSANAGNYTVVVTNSAGTVTSQIAVLTVNPASTSTKPSITTQPASQTANSGSNVTFSVVATGSPAPTYQWQKTAINISGATSSTLTLDAVTSANAGTYTVVVTNSVASVVSQPAVLTVDVVPAITTQPASQTVDSGASVTFSVVATGSPAPTYQWEFNGTNISGATSSTLSLSSVNALNAGNYSVVVTNLAGSENSSNATLTVAAPGSTDFAAPAITSTPPIVVASRLSNLSVRAFSAPGPEVLTAGFVISGGTKMVLIRGVGPTLTEFGVTGVIADPELSLFANGSLIQSNTGWGGSTELSNEFASLGAFALPASSADSAILTSLAPNSYTAEVVSASGANGVALLEVYDADTANPPQGQFSNLSVRAQVNSGDGVLIVGLVVTGDAPVKLLIRAIGPSLSQFGISNVLSSPILSLYQGSNLIQENSGWGGQSTLTEAFAQVGAFALTDPNSLDAAMIATLQPGVYSAVVAGADGTTGIALAEVYVMP
jgi:hypothetical protein